MSANADASHKLTEALNNRDVAAVEELLTEDVIFLPAKAGVQVDGREDTTKALIAWVDAHQEGYRLETIREFFAGDEGYNEWRFEATTLAGDAVDVHGVDYFRFANGKIAEKTSFKKV